jgi:hypothetical protein
MTFGLSGRNTTKQALLHEAFKKNIIAAKETTGIAPCGFAYIPGRL